MDYDFEYYLAVLPQDGLNKLSVLINYLSPQVYDYVSQVTSYVAVTALKALYMKPTNEVFARHQLAIRRQKESESIDEFLQALKILSRDCNFKDVNVATYIDESVWDAFITGIRSIAIRQRLLENKTLDLKTMYDQARLLDDAQRSSEVYQQTNYSNPLPPINAATNHVPETRLEDGVMEKDRCNS